MSLLSIQVTELIDGIFIGCSMNHAVADGSSFWHFLNTLSEVFKAGGEKITISRQPIRKHWFPDGKGPILNFPLLIMISSPRDTLKAKAESNTTTISTQKALSPHRWRCVTRAHGFLIDQNTNCRVTWLVDPWVETNFVYQPDFFDPSSIMMGSPPRFDVYRNDFGLGKAVAIRSALGNKYDGKVSLYPGTEGRVRHGLGTLPGTTIHECS
ncbi:hypothetical protein Pfo_016863 [Paulownia fortunei]|nr:hypothetical protein Pfo_016863 [Paulownia fortunei]